MLSPKCFTREWIDRCTEELRCKNHNILEKAIVALQLVGHLAEVGLPFQFKGGSSLLLVVQPIRRLSIDVDIVTQATPEELKAALDTVGRLSPFNGIEHDATRDAEFPPKKHYRAHYPSLFHPPPHHILLDVLFETASTHLEEPMVIRAPFIDVEREVRVTVPGVNGLLGDKLTAFAPTTIGILYRDDRSADIVKQLFDVGVLFDKATDLQAVAAMYDTMHTNQCKYRQRQYTLDEALDDTIEACVQLSRHDLKGAPKGGGRGPFFVDGIARLQSHLVSNPFNRDHARTAAGKAACVAAWMKRRLAAVTIQSLRYDSNRIQELRTAVIGPPWQPLQRLRGGNPEAFFYWWRAQQLLSDRG